MATRYKLATQDRAETFTNKTLGAGCVNANLTGHVTSTGNAAVLGSFTQAQLNTAVSDNNLWFTKFKVTSENRVNNTLADDAELVIALAGSTKYSIKCVLFLSSANATMDWKFGTAYSGTTTGTAQSYFRALFAGATAGTDVEPTGQAAGQIASTAVAAATTGTAHLTIEQCIETNGAGNWSVQWAQNTTDAGNLTVFFGSYITYSVVS